MDIRSTRKRRSSRPILPIHARDERAKRAKAADSRAGLIDLANDILRVDVRIGAITRAVRAILGLRMAGSIEDTWKRKRTYAVEGFRLWRIVAANSGKLAPLAARLVGVSLPPWVNRVFMLAQAKPDDDESVGATAAALIFKSRWLRRPFRDAARWFGGFLALTPVVVSPVGLIGALAAAGASAAGRWRDRCKTRRSRPNGRLSPCWRIGWRRLSICSRSPPHSPVTC